MLEQNNESSQSEVEELPVIELPLIPLPGTCPVCGVQHRPDFPHNRDSLYYQICFERKHGRGPTWRDAMEHCKPEIKAFWYVELLKLGIEDSQP